VDFLIPFMQVWVIAELCVAAVMLVLTALPHFYTTAAPRTASLTLGLVLLAYPVGIFIDKGTGPKDPLPVALGNIFVVYLPGVLMAGAVLLAVVTLIRRPKVTTPKRGLKRSDKRAIGRGLQYGLFLALLIVVVIQMNWDYLSQRFFTVAALREAWPDQMIHALLNTLKYTLGAFAVSLTLGMILALAKLSSVKLYRYLATGYIELFRGLPALLIVMAVAYGVPMALGIRIPTLALKAAIALGLVSAAYMAESLRAGIQAVPKGQVEAARSLGMSYGQTMISVVIPQAIRIVLPPVTNEIILLTKDTSLVYLAGVTMAEWELTKLARESVAEPYGGLTALFAIGACYLIITLPLGFLVRRMEKGFGKARA
jgi:polar amino acid transport system permease protein